MFSSTLLNIAMFLPNKSSTSNYCPKALLKLCFWSLCWNLLLLLPPPDRCPLKLLLLSRCPLTPRLPSRRPEASIVFPLSLEVGMSFPWTFSLWLLRGHRRRPTPLITPLFCAAATDAVGMSKQTPSLPSRKTSPFTLASISSPSCSLGSFQA